MFLHSSFKPLCLRQFVFPSEWVAQSPFLLNHTIVEVRMPVDAVLNWLNWLIIVVCFDATLFFRWISFSVNSSRIVVVLIMVPYFVCYCNWLFIYYFFCFDIMFPWLFQFEFCTLNLGLLVITHHSWFFIAMLESRL